MSDTELTVENKDEKDGENVLVVGDDQENTVKIEAEAMGVDNTDDEPTQEGPEMKPLNPKKTPLPEVGKIFMMDGFEYKVTYINEGKNRFSAEPCKKQY